MADLFEAFFALIDLLTSIVDLLEIIVEWSTRKDKPK